MNDAKAPAKALLVSQFSTIDRGSHGETHIHKARLEPKIACTGISTSSAAVAKEALVCKPHEVYCLCSICCCVMFSCIIFYSTTLYSFIQAFILPIVVHYTLLYSTLLYSTLLSSTLLCSHLFYWRLPTASLLCRAILDYMSHGQNVNSLQRDYIVLIWDPYSRATLLCTRFFLDRSSYITVLTTLRAGDQSSLVWPRMALYRF